MNLYPHFQHFCPIYEAIPTRDLRIMLFSTCWDSSDRYRDSRTFQQLESNDICRVPCNRATVKKLRTLLCSLCTTSRNRNVRKIAKSDY